MVGYLSLPRLVDPFTPRLDPSTGRNLKLLGPATNAAAPNGACARARLSLPVGAK
jgi:hypothetical protein